MRSVRHPATTPAERLRMALDLHGTGVEMMRQNPRRRHPEASDPEIDRLLLAWLHERPGAEHGDAVGRPRRGGRAPS